MHILLCAYPNTLCEQCHSRSKASKEPVALAWARVPIVKINFQELQCDICINNSLAVLNTALLNVYGKCDERVLPLVRLVKHWAAQRQVNRSDQGSLSSYGHALMVIHFLMIVQPPVLCDLTHSDLLASCSPEDILDTNVDGVPVRFCQSPAAATRLRSSRYAANDASLSLLLRGYFNYWNCRFDFAMSTATVRKRNSYTLSKTVWGTKAQMWRLSIEDPFETHDCGAAIRSGHDLGDVISREGMSLIQQQIHRADQLLNTSSDEALSISLYSSIDRLFGGHREEPCKLSVEGLGKGGFLGNKKLKQHSAQNASASWRQDMADIASSVASTSYPRPVEMNNPIASSVVREYPLLHCSLLEPIPVFFPSSPSPILAAQTLHSYEMMQFLSLDGEKSVESHEVDRASTQAPIERSERAVALWLNSCNSLWDKQDAVLTHSRANIPRRQVNMRGGRKRT